MPAVSFKNLRQRSSEVAWPFLAKLFNRYPAPAVDKLA